MTISMDGWGDFTDYTNDINKTKIKYNEKISI